MGLLSYYNTVGVALCAVVAISGCAGADGEPAAETAQAAGGETVELPPGACSSVADQAALEVGLTDVTAHAQVCFDQCLASAEAHCIRDCLLAQLHVSKPCGDCFQDLLACVVEECGDLCTNDSDSAACDLCVVDAGCDPNFVACSGIQTTTSIVVQVEDDRCNKNEQDPELATLVEAGTPVVGACTSEANPVIASPEFQDTSKFCGEACYAKGWLPTAQCLVERTGMSRGCAVCLGWELACAAEKCTVPCL